MAIVSPVSRSLRFVVIALTAMLLLGACATNSKNKIFDLVAQADAAYARGDWQQAERHYMAVVEVVPKDAYAYFRLGNVYAKQMNFDAAMQAYQAAIVRQGDMTKAYNNLALVHVLQAKRVLEAGQKTMRKGDPLQRRMKKMLREVQKIADIAVQETTSPAARQRGAK